MDGAHIGVRADRALETILGGEDQPTEEEESTPEEMLASIRAASLATDNYGDAALAAALAAARVIWEAWERYPELVLVPSEAVYERGDDGRMVVRHNETDEVVTDGDWSNAQPNILVPDLFDALKRLHPEGTPEREALSDLTGYMGGMWGWAYNACRYSLGAGPVANPAIMTVGAAS